MLIHTMDTRLNPEGFADVQFSAARGGHSLVSASFFVHGRFSLESFSATEGLYTSSLLSSLGSPKTRREGVGRIILTPLELQSNPTDSCLDRHLILQSPHREQAVLERLHDRGWVHEANRPLAQLYDTAEGAVWLVPVQYTTYERRRQRDTINMLTLNGLDTFTL